MADVRIRIDHDQLGIIIAVMDIALKDRVRGEALNIVWSIVEQLSNRLKKRHAIKRIDHLLILPIYQALALRRMAIAGQAFVTDQRHIQELRLILMTLDPKVAHYVQ